MEINDNLVVAIIGLLCLGVGYVTYFLNKYTDKLYLEIKNIKDDTQRTLFENVLKDFHDIVYKSVTYAEQVVVRELKEKSSDGKLTKDEGRDIMDEVFSSVMDSLTPFAKEILEKNIKNFEKYTISAIETKVFELKK